MSDAPVGGTAAEAPPVAPVVAPVSPDFFSAIPKELREDPSLKDFKNPADLAKSYKELKAMLGGSIRIPAPDAKPEEWDKVFQKLGWPETPDKYSRLDPKTAPDGLTVSEEFMNEFYKAAHAKRLNNRQANELLQTINEMQLKNLKDLDTKAKEAEDAARARLDQAFGKAKDARIEGVRRFLSQKATPEVLAKINDSGWGNDPDFIVMMDRLAGEWVEDHAITRNRGVDPTFSRPDQIRERIRELQKDPIYMNGNHPKHMALVEEVQNLYRMANQQAG